MPISPSSVLPKRIPHGPHKPSTAMQVSPLLLEASGSEAEEVMKKLQTSKDGLSGAEATRRLKEYGPNVVAREARHSHLRLLGKALVNPLVILLLVIAASSFLTGDFRAGIVVLLMVILGVGLSFFQEARASSAAAKLQAMISIFLPFVPMAPLQILTNNLLYNISQVPIPTDDVDPEQIAKPRPWSMNAIARFILFIGPCSSIFDYTTFFIMLYVFGCWVPTGVSEEQLRSSASLFQTGWFVESLLTQTLIIHVIRTNRIPFLQSWASWPLIVTTAVIMLIGALLPFSPLGPAFGFTPLPLMYWPIMAATLFGYVLLTHVVKTWLFRKGGHGIAPDEACILSPFAFLRELPNRTHPMCISARQRWPLFVGAQGHSGMHRGCNNLNLDKSMACSISPD